METEPITEDRMKDIDALFQRVSLQGEDLHHKGTPWPDVVGKQHSAIWDLFREVRRLQKLIPSKGRHSV
jgi:hypothetical protein